MRLLIGSLLLLTLTVKAQKRMVITIDDLPTVSTFYKTPLEKQQLTQKLLAHVTYAHAPAIGFVISGLLQSANRPDTAQLALLQQWLDAGLELGNHTFAHKDYNLIPFSESKADVIQGESIVKNFVKKQGKPFHYFRHPYLRKGDTMAKKDSLEHFLRQWGYREAPVTIDNSDWVYARAYDNALKVHDATLLAQVGQSYVSYMLNCVAYYEAQSMALFNRPMAQVLLIHANSINADFLGKLLGELKNRGYSFITLDEALKDEAYQSADTYTGKGGISWLHRWALTKGKKGEFFKGEPEVPATIDELANRQ
ncbi:polysaccharide deacetylase family protein [Spirosoma panaciterrae]|uniref:polysaccharide deacetylase family protein n=1 Tax=Spirosoma panaciterrae TaxID=496058 RepID=UPI000362C81D|nr:polysaccharide deacetylase family protein [Spirosoma panaciterrae]